MVMRPNLFLAPLREAGFLVSLAILLLLAGCGGRLTTGPVTEPVPPGPSPVPKEGVYHTLQRGQTLYSLSRAYRVPVSVLQGVNGIADPRRIPAGARIFIPGATRVLSVSPPARPVFGWPLRGRITSGFGPRGNRARHEGIDIDGEFGEIVRAARPGTVTRAGKGRGYGLMVVIDHGGGLSTLYAHASQLLVRVGGRVERGDPISRVGRSGNARGTHLHFEVRRRGRPVNPVPLLGERGSPSSVRR